MLGTKSEPTFSGFSDSMADLAPVLQQQAEPGAHYLPPSRIQLVEKLEHLCRYSPFIQVVLGVAGSGKSALLEQLLPSPEDYTIKACLLRAERDWRVADLLDQLSLQLDLDPPVSASDDAKLQLIYEHADLLQDTSRLFLILVDDADHLDDDCLDVLLNLLPSVRNPDARPHLLLFAAPALADRLNTQARFEDAVSAGCHFVELRPFNIEETQGFLQHRFGLTAGELTERQLQSLQRDSFGIPGRLPKAMEKWLATGGRADKGRVSPSWNRFPRLHLLLACAVFITAFVGWLLMPASVSVNDSDRVRVELPLPANLVVDKAAEPDPEPTISQTLEQRLKEAQARLQAEADTNLQQVTDSGSVASGTDEQGALGDSSSVAAVEPVGQLLVAPVSKPPASAANSTVKPGTLVLQLPAIGDAPGNKPKSQLPASHSAPVKPSVDTAPPRVAQKTSVLPKPPVVQLTPIVRSAASPYQRENELLSWAADHYTLQMLGARKQQSVVQFIESQQTPKDFYYFSTDYKGKPWYVVVYGNYADRDQAVAAAKKLPAQLRKQNPWARSVQGVQDDIRRKK